jgi:hypothetical protein
MVKDISIQFNPGTGAPIVDVKVKCYAPEGGEPEPISYTMNNFLNNGLWESIMAHPFFMERMQAQLKAALEKEAPKKKALA